MKVGGWEDKILNHHGDGRFVKMTIINHHTHTYTKQLFVLQNYSAYLCTIPMHKLDSFGEG